MATHIAIPMDVGGGGGGAVHTISIISQLLLIIYYQNEDYTCAVHLIAGATNYLI